MGRWDDDEPKEKRKERQWRPNEDEPKQKRPRRESEQWGKREPASREEGQPPAEEVDPEQPNFGLSGLLAKEANRDEQSGVILKYHEPQEAKRPTKRWRLHVFKDEESLPIIPLHNHSMHLIGRDRKVCHIPTDHPSCSKQHAVIQFRQVPLLDDVSCPTGRTVIKPYLMDLESANGVLLNNKKIKPARYVELVINDCIKFGFSSREYVLLFEEAIP